MKKPFFSSICERLRSGNAKAHLKIHSRNLHDMFRKDGVTAWYIFTISEFLKNACFLFLFLLDLTRFRMKRVWFRCVREMVSIMTCSGRYRNAVARKIGYKRWKIQREIRCGTALGGSFFALRGDNGADFCFSERKNKENKDEVTKS